MIIEIDDTQKVTDIQDRFASCFPTLKLEFCRKKHGWEDMCPEREFFDGNTRLSSIRKSHEPGIIEIKSWSKVGEVEKEFYQKFGMSVQICYQCGQRWIQSGKSDNLTIDSLQKKSFAQPVKGLL
jgi:hypothetical protein